MKKICPFMSTSDKNFSPERPVLAECQEHGCMAWREVTISIHSEKFGSKTHHKYDCTLIVGPIMIDGKVPV